MENECGIYRILAPSGISYVGLTSTSFTARWNEHKKRVRLGTHPCKHFANSYKKYGEKTFVFEVLEVINKPKNSDDLSSFEKSLLERERFWWDYIASHEVIPFNARPTGTGSVFHTEESKQAISKSMMDPASRENLFCPVCQNNFEAYRRKKRKFCSKDCADKGGYRAGVQHSGSSSRGKRNMHNRWHVKRNLISEACDFCLKSVSE